MANPSPNNFFNWDSEEAADLTRTFSSMIKYNDGCFKSSKQANFLLTGRHFIERRTDYDNIQNVYGVEVVEGQVAVILSGYTRWADYGSKSIRPCSWVYILDEIGIVSKFKLKYVGDMRSGTTVDPKATTKEWQRFDNINPEWATPEGKAADAEAAVAVQAAKDAIGYAGRSDEIITNLKLTLTRIIDGGQGQWGYEYTSIFKTEDGKLIYWKNIPNFRPGDPTGFAAEGDVFELKRARVKNQFITKAGIKAVSMTRPTWVK